MKRQAFKNILHAHQIILWENFTVNKETFCSPVMGQKFFYILFTSMLSSKNTSAKFLYERNDLYMLNILSLTQRLITGGFGYFVY